jgi:hypothetical protein
VVLSVREVRGRAAAREPASRVYGARGRGAHILRGTSGSLNGSLVHTSGAGASAG